MGMNEQGGLFSGLRVNTLRLPNRFVMPAMQRGFCRNGRPAEALAAYYRRRVEGSVALIISESCAIDHPSATAQPSAAALSDATLNGWAMCAEEVHRAGGHFLIQLWHEGALRTAQDGHTISPSGWIRAGKANGRAAGAGELEAVKAAYVAAAFHARQIGADGVEVHAAHGFLLDQFLWSQTNRREDIYGGADLADRARFPAGVVADIRAACGPDFVISFRFSQWKEADYDASIASSPVELSRFIQTIEKAGADLLHVSTRRFWTPEWPDDPRGLAGWVRSFTSLPVITVGSVGLDRDVMTSFSAQSEARSTVSQSVAELERRFALGEFDLVSIGRGLIGDPDFVMKVRERRYDAIRAFQKSDLAMLEWDMGAE